VHIEIFVLVFLALSGLVSARAPAPVGGVTLAGAMRAAKGLSSASAIAAADIRDVYQGVERDSAGYKMLSSMGWSEGDGLVRVSPGAHFRLRAAQVSIDYILIHEALRL
jgi:G-patch domain